MAEELRNRENIKMSLVENCDDCGLESNTYLQLHVTERAINQATLQLSWCLDKKVLDRLVQSDSVVDPKVLISVVPLEKIESLTKRSIINVEGFEKRYLFNLTDLMCFIPLEYSGKVAVFATIVWGRSAQARFLRRDCEVYNTTIMVVEQDEEDRDDISLKIDASMFDNYGVHISDSPSDEPKFLYSRININVPKEVFAKEPPEWVSQWVNHFFAEKQKDECNLRRRYIFAFAVQPIVFLFIFLSRYVSVLFGLLCLRQGLNFKPLVNPYMTWDQIWEGSRLEFFPNWNSPFKAVLIPFLPIIWLPLLCVSFAFGLPLSFIASVISMLSLIPLLSLIIAFTFPKINDKINSKKEDQIESNDRGFWYDGKDLETITCITGREYNSVKDLPKKYRTFKLRFQELKTKVCKPFARN